MKIYFSMIALLFVTVCGQSQNLVGYKSSEIKDYMKLRNKDLALQNVVNDKYSYLKYTDSNDSETLLFFLNADSVCKSVRLICDRVTRNERIKEFNSGYQIINENVWIDTLGRKRSIIRLDDGKWSSHFTIEPVKKDGSN
jgi:hypothetical protein